MILAEVSPTAGDRADGVVLGSVLESQIVAALETQERCLQPSVYRLDRSGSSLRIVDEATAAVATAANSWSPFGDAVQFSDGDEFLVGCDEEFVALLFRVDTVGAHSATLRVYDSEDGVWATHEITVTDDSAAFESSGWRRIEIPASGARRTWQPSHDPTLAIVARKYIRFRLDGIQAGNTPPAISNLVLIRASFRWQDHTAVRNGDTAVAPAADQHYPWPGSTWQLAFSDVAYGAEVYMHLASTSVITDAHEYLASDGNWKALSGWTNASNDFTVGPSVLGNPVQKLPIRWTVPSDWASASQTVMLDDGSSVTRTGYWLRERTVTVTSYGAYVPARYRVRVRQFGNANTTGWEMVEAGSIKGISLLSASVPNTTACEMQIANMTTGRTVAFTVAANPTFPTNWDTADLAFAAGDRVGIICTSGGTLRAAQVAISF